MTTTNVDASSSGVIESRHATYSNARSGSGATITADTDGDYLRVGQTLSGGLYYCWETFLAFDLSAITTGSTIDSASLGLAPNNGVDHVTSFVLRVRDLDWSAGGLTTADYVPGASLGSTGSLRAHYDMAGGWSPNGTRKTLADDALAAAVAAAAGGTLYLVAYSARQEAGTTPTDAEFDYFGGHTDSTPARLTVDWTAPSAPGARYGAMRAMRRLRGMRS